MMASAGGLQAADDSSPSPQPASTRSYLAFDFGTRRVGIASGNDLLGTATPLRTLDVEGDARFAAIGALIHEWRPDALVVGIPFHPDGAAHDNTRRAERFARQLGGRFGLSVERVDERYSTVEVQARQRAAPAKRFDVDAASAALILEQFLGASR